MSVVPANHGNAQVAGGVGTAFNQTGVTDGSGAGVLNKGTDQASDNAIVEQASNGKVLADWGPQEIQNWLGLIGFGQMYGQHFYQHHIDGKAVVQLNPELAKEMGIISVGHRLTILSWIKKLQTINRQQWRSAMVFEGEEYRPGPFNNVLPFGFPFCFEMCTGKPAIYKVTNSKLSVVQNIKAVNFPFMGWCGFTTTVFTVDLSDVSDVDLTSGTACMGDPPAMLVVNSSKGPIFMILVNNMGDEVKTKIEQAKEEAVIQANMVLHGGAPADQIDDESVCEMEEVETEEMSRE
eukprot:CAMPEP_0119543090 /NCGR_PEP_ID=MMETSP1344-20130328/53937_1 /TAXON_ID=236787 /ORGANISM="Florenciella parvula, Strain CCMP2471" /LENGTH=292 /DNA_ID=CAMNT_0007587363 /DNA_START=15 /DNA_END=893 /DNA_ORIENTATION=+